MSHAIRITIFNPPVLIPPSEPLGVRGRDPRRGADVRPGGRGPAGAGGGHHGAHAAGAGHPPRPRHSGHGRRHAHSLPHRHRAGTQYSQLVKELIWFLKEFLLKISEKQPSLVKFTFQLIGILGSFYSFFPALVS